MHLKVAKRLTILKSLLSFSVVSMFVDPFSNDLLKKAEKHRLSTHRHLVADSRISFTLTVSMRKVPRLVRQGSH